MDLLSAARDLAQLGGNTARALLGSVSVERKQDNTPVTEADHRVQAAMLAVIAQCFPTHSIIVEESVPHPERHTAIRSAEYCWVIDPVDGTRNFARGSTMYATSVGVLLAGEPIVGAIYDASTGRTYSAVRGGGAYCDGQPIRVTSHANPADTTVLLSSFRRRPMEKAVAGWMNQLLYRNLGSLCLHLAWVAAGYADAAYAPECKLWDLAAGSLLIEEAGGVVTDVAGQRIWPMEINAYRGEDIPILVGAPAMHEQLLESLRND
ncbi:MAG TPA: inositol monophosphatase [Phycisphaerae bacterium]|nr:inositol monophosphatase [Phycisphaerae bacterium]